MKYFVNFIILIFTFGSAGAQNNYRSIGTVEFGGDFGFAAQSSNLSDNNFTTISSNLYIGYMFSEGFSMGLRPGFMIQSNDGDSYKVFNIFLNPNYNIKANNVIPYFGVLIGYGSQGFNINGNDNIIEGIGIGGEAGIKFPVSNAGLFLIRLEYLSQKYEYGLPQGFNNVASSETVTTLLFSAGFRIFIERGNSSPQRQ